MFLPICMCDVQLPPGRCEHRCWYRNAWTLLNHLSSHLLHIVINEQVDGTLLSIPGTCCTILFVRFYLHLPSRVMFALIGSLGGLCACQFLYFWWYPSGHVLDGCQWNNLWYMWFMVCVLSLRLLVPFSVSIATWAQTWRLILMLILMLIFLGHSLIYRTNAIWRTLMISHWGVVPTTGRSMALQPQELQWQRR